MQTQTIEIIKSTVPVLETHGTAITTRFYEILFERHPELKNIFNQTNQGQGRQQTALANAIYAAAVHIDKLEEILPAVTQIAHKHRSIGIQPAHYPLVGSALLAAISDVLGNNATPEVLNAWGEAYQTISAAFIATEHDLYDRASHQRGGWEGYRAFRIVKKVAESEVITSFYLEPQDGNEIATFLPGQFVSVKLEDKTTGAAQIRQYSLSDSPDRPYYRISVKREPEGMVSNYLHDHIHEGGELHLSAPAGEFVLDTSSQSPVALISGGVGLTPMVSMLNHLVEQHKEREVVFIHAALNSSVHAMRSEIQQLSAKHPQIELHICYENPTENDVLTANYDKEGFIDLTWLKKIVSNANSEFYFCGPIPFMRAVYRALKEWNVPEPKIHFEFFGPAGSIE